MSPTTLTILILVFFCVDAIVVYAIFSIAAGELRTLATRFPSVPVKPGAERRTFQSFRLDLFNFGWSIHATLDATHLHLQPAWLFRRFGAGACSIPREQLKAARRTLTGAKVELRGTTLHGPRWCLLADTPRS